ncbi:MAG: ABC transporter ATP-binding protein [Candidatus Limnocylindria bacterium]
MIDPIRTDSGPPAVELVGVTKYFASTDVLADDDVSVTVQPGEVHAIVGENGAGKSTLMNILFGLEQPDRGEIRVFGQPVRLRSADDALSLGIGMVHQHFKLIGSFTVAQNVLLGAEPSVGGFLRQAEEEAAVARLSEEFGLPIDPGARVADLPVGLQQRVEILKALQRNARILILDEPTAVLTPHEARALLAVLRGFAAGGRSVLLITHKLMEVIDAADRVTVMRHGRVVATVPAAGADPDALARLMVGRDVLLTAARRGGEPGNEILNVDNLSVVADDGTVEIDGVSFGVRAREVVGIAGVSGNGQDALAAAIAGLRTADGGTIRLGGTDIGGLPVHRRRALGLAHIPEDRLTTGLNLEATLDENVLVAHYRGSAFSRLGILRADAAGELAGRITRDFAVTGSHPGEGIATLSGGNLQKIVLGRELAGDPRFILANQPTRGLDVGSIEFVHETLLKARDAGAALLLISAEIDEILALSDRILVLFRGRVVADLSPADADPEQLGILMAGGKTE